MATVKLTETDERKTASFFRTFPAQDRKGNGEPSGQRIEIASVRVQA